MTLNLLPKLRLQSLGELFDLAILGLFAFSLLVIQPVQADGPLLPLNDYWEKLQKTKDLISRLEDAEAERDTIRAQLSAEADNWAEIEGIILADGTTVPLDHTFLVSQLRANPPDLGQLAGLLATLLEARERSAPWTFGEAPEDELAAILARSEFQWKEEETTPSWQEGLWRRFLAWVDSWFPEGEGAFVSGSFLNYILTGLGTLALVLVLAYIFRSLSISFVSDTAIDPDTGAEGEFLSADIARRRAHTLSGDGDYRTAARYLYLSALLSLEERGLLRYNRSLTNREYLRSVAHLPELAHLLREVVEVFDRVWYGYQSLDQTTYAQYVRQVAALNKAKIEQPKVGRV